MCVCVCVGLMAYNGFRETLQNYSESSAEQKCETLNTWSSITGSLKTVFGLGGQFFIVNIFQIWCSNI